MGVLTNFLRFNPRALFVETGAGDGLTMDRAARYFDRCVSIDWDLAVLQKLAGRWPNVELCHGHSPDVLRVVIDPAVPTIFWLDAHYTGNGEPVSPHGECPVLDELRVIAATPWVAGPIVLVDDGFMFDDALPSPVDPRRFNRAGWPRVAELDAVMVGHRRTVTGGHIFQYEAAA